MQCPSIIKYDYTSIGYEFAKTLSNLGLTARDLDEKVD